VPKYNWTYPAYVALPLLYLLLLLSDIILSWYNFVILKQYQHNINNISRNTLHTLAVESKNRLVTIAREEGVRALWKGFVPKVLRLAPGGGVLLLVVEVVSEGFRKCECCLASAYQVLYLTTPSPTVLGPPYI